MSDYGTMQSRIADEINRSDITTNIQSAILTAIRFYRKEKLWFNQATGTVTASQGVRTTALPSDWQAPVFLRLEITTGSFYPITQENYTKLEDWYLGTSQQGFPEFYAVYGSNFFWFPIPIQNYTVYLSYIKQLTEPSGSADTNAWFTDGEALIREHAKGLLYQDVLYDAQNASAAFALANAELSRLKSENSGRNFNTSFEASW